ncbi:MAG: hypothetical protein JNK61_09810 [Bacteroidia bacterium]|nr:hypothetical protein [Bacteroidia bacterium]HQV00498.1 hypothetical protein [Bacteroidia bacterium]
MKNTLLVLSTLGCIIWSCSPKTAPTSSQTKPATEQAPDNSIPVSVDMASAEKTYRSVCSGCHELYPTTNYTAAEWGGIVNRMQKKANFSNSDKNLIMAFLSANAKK